MYCLPAKSASAEQWQHAGAALPGDVYCGLPLSLASFFFLQIAACLLLARADNQHTPLAQLLPRNVAERAISAWCSDVAVRTVA